MFLDFGIWGTISGGNLRKKIIKKIKKRIMNSCRLLSDKNK